jgi:hypothetical protein
MSYNQNVNHKKIIKKGMKYYLKAKENLEKDENISTLYFQKSLECFNKIKNQKKYKQLILETETECNKIIESKNKKNDIFDLIDKGDIKSIKNIKIKDLNKRKDGLTPYHYAIKNGDLKSLKIFLKKTGNIDQINDYGHTLLDYACLEKDPNAISFLIEHGGNMKKHLYFRKGSTLFLNKSDIDLAILLKLTILNFDESTEIDKTKFILDYINPNESIKIKNFNQNDFYTTNDLLKGLEILLSGLDNNKTNSYLSIIKEELEYKLKNKLGCPDEKIDILLINLIPFIDYKFNLSSKFLLSLEIKYIIKKLLRKKHKNNLDLKKNLLNEVWKSYINNNLQKEDYIGIITNQWISKINL